MSVVLTERRAVLLLEPRMAVSQNVEHFSASPSGRFVVAVQEVPGDGPLTLGQQPPAPKGRFVALWDSTRGTTRQIALPGTTYVRQVTVQWFPKNDVALISVPTGEMRHVGAGEQAYFADQQWHLLDAASGTMRKVHSSQEAGGRSRFVFSPVGTNAVCVMEKFAFRDDRYEAHLTVQELAPNGTWSREIVLSEEYAGSGGVEWSPDGRSLQIEAQKRTQGGKYEPRVLIIELGTGQTTEAIGPVPIFEHKPLAESDLVLQPEAMTLEKDPRKRGVVVWWLRSRTETENPQAVVAEHATAAELPHGQRFVAYVVNGTLFTRQIVEMSLDQYRQARDAAARAEVLSKAKQVGLGVLIYLTDHDDTLGPDFKVSDLEPYLKNNSLLDGFVMVWPGGSINDVKEPASTVMGYIEGADGRAVVYLDGHVKWEKKG
jgi:hypothetical protein